MGPGSLLDNRFEIEEEAGRGGMGVVYRAKDSFADGARVAIKVLPVGGAVDRFAQEAKVLSRLHHPAIVRHVASGHTEEGLPYIAMEWLEGEDLAARFAREGLRVGEAIAVIRRIAEALAAAHAIGITHRDVKPSNIWLVDRDVSKATLLDFGIATLSHGTRVVTSTGAFVGTLGYSAPEHAEGSREIDGRADVYSLGCVLYECLTGQPAFLGDNALEILAKSMLEGVPDVRAVRPEIDPEIAALVSKMTARQRAERFESCGELCDAIDAVTVTPSARVPMAAHPTRLSSEQRLVSLALLVAAESTVAGQTTISPQLLDDQDQKALALVKKFGGEMRSLSNGLLVTLTGGSSAQDLALNATQCALALKVIHPNAEAVLATGRMDAGLDASAVVGRAVALLDKGYGLGLLRVDETTASLISSRFVLRDQGGVSIVIGRADADSPVRTLIGKPMPCVGRDKEIALLAATFDECVEESVARLVLVTAPPGTGKSRLRFELTERVDASHPNVIRLAASADAGARAALSVAAALVLDAAGTRVGDPVHARSSAIEAHVTSLVGLSMASSAEEQDRSARLVEFLCELCASPKAGPPSDLLTSARHEARIMNEWMQRAFEDWVGWLTKRGPVLMVLEDMHWADEASLLYLAGSLRRVAESPLFVLGLARPEIHDRLPEALSKIGIQEVRLSGLTRRSAERLVRFAVPTLNELEVSEIVTRADGNAFFLEELIRWSVTQPPGKSGTSDVPSPPMPDTVLMMLQSRLEKLQPLARRVLRAASVFGGSAWEEAIAAVLGGTTDINAWLDALVGEEIFVRSAESRFTGKTEIAFRHALLRDAAYAMLTPEDRREGHELAARWLEAAGERDPLVLAVHFYLANDTERPAPLFLRAAELAADAGNLASVLQLTQRGLELGGSAETRAHLTALRAQAFGWSAQWGEVLELAPRAMAALEPGSVSWWLMAGGIVFASSSTADPQWVPGVMREVLALPGQPEATGPCGFAMTLFTLGSLSAGRIEVARAFSRLIEQMGADQGERDPVFAGWLRLIRDAMAFYHEDDPATAYREVREGVALFDAAMDPVGLSLARVYEGTVLLETGDSLGAEAVFREADRLANASGVRYSRVIARAYLARAMTSLGRPRDALTLFEEIEDERDVFLSSLARAGASEAHLALGDRGLARTLAERVLAVPATISLPQTLACSVLARLSLAETTLDEALAHVDRGLAIAAVAAFPRCRSELFMARAEALARLRRGAEAAPVQQEARTRVERIANGLANAGFAHLHDAWLRVPANRLAMM